MSILKKFWIIAGLTLFLAGVGWGASYTWETIATDGEWGTAANWDPPTGPPGDNDNITIPPGASSYPEVPASVGTLDSIEIQGGTLTVPQDLQVTNAVTLTSGTLELASVTLTVGTITGGGRITGTSPTISASGDIDLAGTHEITASITLTSTDGKITFTNDVGAGNELAITEASADGDIEITETTGDLTVGVAGISSTGGDVILTAGGDLTITGSITTTGTDTVALTSGGSVTQTGTISADNITLNMNGTGSLDTSGTTFDEVTISATGTITLANNLTAVQTEITSGTLDTATNGSSSNLGALNMSGGTLILAGTETISSSSLSGGTVIFTGANNTLAGITDFYNVTIQNGTRTAAAKITVEATTTINSGATLDLDAYDLSTTSLTIGGTLIAGPLITLNGGTWSRTGIFTHGGGTNKVVFNGATVNDENTFNIVECTGTVSFENGKTQTITVLNATGATSLTRSGTTDHWYVTVLTAANFTTSDTTTISWCSSTNHLGRTTSVGTYQAINGNNNVRVFYGGTFTWTGVASSAWNNAGNWNPASIPDQTDDTTEIIIPAVTAPPAYQLVLNVTNVQCGKLTIASGATVDLNNNNLTVAETLINGGNLDLRGAVLTVGTLTNSGTISLYGVAGQVIVDGDPPAGRAAGTIHYYNNTASPPHTANWVFGENYTNLIVASTVTMVTAGDLNVSGTATFGSAISADSVQVDGTTDINANITTTTGTQRYGDAAGDTVTLGANVTLTGTTVTINGTIDGGTNNLTITANMATLRGGSDIGALEIIGNATFQPGPIPGPGLNPDPLSAVSVEVSGTSDINADITTTGSQRYGTAPANTVTLGGTGTRTLTATGASATVTLGKITGGGHDLSITADTTTLNSGSGIGVLTITGNAVFEVDPDPTPGPNPDPLSAVSVNVTRNTTINANISTTGSQSYGTAATDTVTLGGAGTQELTSTGGFVRAIGIVSATAGTPGITVNASLGIDIDNPGNTLSGNITLNNNRGTPAGDVSFATVATALIRVSGTNVVVSPNLGGDFTVSSAGNIEVDTPTLSAPGIAASGTVKLETSDGNITVTDSISGNSVELKAVEVAPNTGNITVNSTISGDTVELTADGNITETGAGVISSTGTLRTLTLEAGGVITLNGANSVGTLQITGAGGAVGFTNNAALVITGISASGQQVTLTRTGTGAVTQNSASSAAIICGTLILSGGTSFVLNNTANDIAILQTSGPPSMPTAITYVDVDAFEVGTGGITSSGAVNLTAANSLTISGSITTDTGINGEITLRSVNTDISIDAVATITGYRLALLAENGTITINGNISVYSEGNEDNIPTDPNRAAVYVLAKTFTGTSSSNIILNDTAEKGQVCVYMYETPTYMGNVKNYMGTVTENRIHYHAMITRGHIVYRKGTDTSGGTLLGVSNPYVYINSDDAPAGVFLPESTAYNVYIIDVGSTTKINTFREAAVIEVRGTYSAPSVTLEPVANGIIRLADGANPAAIALSSGSFDFTGNIEVAGANTTPASISAASITMGDATHTINGTTSEANRLSLTSTSGDISIQGDTGDTIPLGDLTINSSGAIHIGTANDITIRAKSFTQTGTAGTNFGSASSITTTGSISFAGPLLTGNLTMAAGAGNISAAGQVGTDTDYFGNITVNNAGNVTFSDLVYAAAMRINNSGAYTQNGAITASENFYQNGSGTVSLGAGIEVTNADKTNAFIRFNRPLGLAAGVTLKTPPTGGTIQLDGGESGNGFILTLEGGAEGSPLDISCSGASAAIDSVAIAEDSYVAVVSGRTIQMGAGALPPADFPAFTGGFAGFSGELILGTNTTLSVMDFYNSAGHKVTVNGTNTTVIASGNVRINSTFADGAGTLRDSTLIMTGSGKTLALNQTDIGNLTVKGTIVLASNAAVRGDITIDAGTLYGGEYTINVFPLALTSSINTWQQINGGVFDYGASTVEFGRTGRGAIGNTYIIRGDTTWYTFACHENAAVLQFSNYVPGSPGHRVFNALEILPESTSDRSMSITLTRIDGTIPPYPNDPADPPYVAPENVNEHFWYFTMDPAGKMDINFIIIKHSFSSRKIPVPTESSNVGGWYISAWPYVAIGNPSNPVEYDEYSNNSTDILDIDGYTKAFLDYPGNRFNVNWFVFNSFFYAYAEDSNHNGKIDRIRLQSAFDLNDDFSDFKIALADAATGVSYTEAITGYERVQKDVIPGQAYDLNSIYVLLDDSKLPYDTSVAFEWKITDNTTLKDLLTKRTLIGNPAGGDLDQDEGITTDTAPPRVTYALAIPGHNEFFFQVSEPVDNPGDLKVNVPDLGLSGLTPVALNNREFLVPLGSASFTPAQLFGDVSFTVEGLRDAAEPTEDLSTPSPDRPYYFMYPPPKYPQNFNYDNVNANDSAQPFIFQSYISVPTINGGLHPPAVPAAALPLSTTEVVFPKNGSYNLITGVEAPAEHRATDMLISIPPTDLKEASQHGQFFIWPLWAKYRDDPDIYGELGEFNPSGYGYLGRDTPFNESDIIWDFTGKRFLEQHDLTLQSRTSDAINPGAANTIIYGFGVPDEYKSTVDHSSPGLWHPGPPLDNNPNPVFVNLFPLLSPPSSVKVMSSVGTKLYNHDLLKSEYPGDTTVEFFYHLEGTSDNTLAARLDTAPGAPIPADWYHKIKPFTFGLHDVTRQRGGVTILNNVINSERRERVFVDYKLNKTGRVTIQVFTLDGNLVKVLVRENQSASDTFYRVSWDGTNNGGRPVARGMYFIRVVAPDIDEIRKVMVVK